MQNVIYALRLIGAIVLGEALLVILITLVQENLFGGVSWTETPLLPLGLAGLGTFVSAVVAGYMAQWVFKKRGFIPHIILTVLIVLETTYLLMNDKTTDPLWFDLLAAASLIAGVWLGGWWRRHYNRSRIPSV